MSKASLEIIKQIYLKEVAKSYLADSDFFEVDGITVYGLRISGPEEIANLKMAVLAYLGMRPCAICGTPIDVIENYPDKPVLCLTCYNHQLT